jgi:predicted nucleic acid-binding protein
MIYLDSSALITFIVRRRHVDALERFLSAQKTKTCTSTIGMVETVRTCDQVGSYPNLMTWLTQQYFEVNVTDSIRDTAAALPGALKALDALHIASAEQFGPELEALVTYDRRMAGVARTRGLPVAMPGLE